MDDFDKIKKLLPKQVLDKFGEHKLCKNKCLMEKDALKMCIEGTLEKQ